MGTIFSSANKPSLDASHIEDLKQAASKMRSVERRSFEAAMALKYCGGSARQAEKKKKGPGSISGIVCKAITPRRLHPR